MSGHHLRRLHEAMSPDPTEWRFTGRICDSGDADGSECACGHRIRYEFFIERQRDRKQLVIGSTCIEESVPFLMSAGATLLANDLQRANKDHKRKLEKERRDARAQQDLPVVNKDLWALINWFKPTKAAHDAAVEAKGHTRVYWPDDISTTPWMPDPSSTPGRTAASLRKRYMSNFIKAVRYVHETEGAYRELPPLPGDPKLRYTVGEAIREHVANPESEFHAAARFAQLAYHGNWDEAIAVPLPTEAARRDGYVRPHNSRRGDSSRALREATSSLTPNPALAAAKARTFAGDEDAAGRRRAFQDALRRGQA